jgi:hypothetical protein
MGKSMPWLQERDSHLEKAETFENLREGRRSGHERVAVFCPRTTHNARPSWRRMEPFAKRSDP